MTQRIVVRIAKSGGKSLQYIVCRFKTFSLDLQFTREDITVGTAAASSVLPARDTR